MSGMMKLRPCRGREHGAPRRCEVPACDLARRSPVGFDIVRPGESLAEVAIGAPAAAA